MVSQTAVRLPALYFLFSLFVCGCGAPRPSANPAKAPFPRSITELKTYLLPIERQDGYSPYTLREEGKPLHHPLLDSVFAYNNWQTAYQMYIDGDSIPDWLIATYSGGNGPDHLLLSTAPEKPFSIRRSPCRPALALPSGDPSCPLLAIEAGLEHYPPPSRRFLDSIPLRMWRGLLVPCGIDTSRRLPFENLLIFTGGGLSRGFLRYEIDKDGRFRFKRRLSFGSRRLSKRKGKLNRADMETLEILLANLKWKDEAGRPAHYSACMTDVGARTITLTPANGEARQITDGEFYGAYLLRALANWAQRLETEKRKL